MHMNVLYQFNEKYAPYAGVSITSLFENNKNADEICVYILGENLSETSKRKLKSLEQEYKRKILFKDTQALVEKMKEWGVPAYRGSYAANMRLFLPMILQEDVDRILYLDADTIVQGSLQPLFEMEDAKAALGMVLDSLGQNHKRTIGLREEDLYYNSGVILFFMSNWKEYRCTERIIEHIEAGNTMYSAPDQDLLNVVCREEILKLPAKYNAQPVHRVYHVNDYFKCYGSRAYYSEEDSAGNIIDNENFDSFGNVKVHAAGNLTTRGVLIRIICIRIVSFLTIIWRNLHGRIISGKKQK